MTVAERVEIELMQQKEKCYRNSKFTVNVENIVKVREIILFMESKERILKNNHNHLYKSEFTNTPKEAEIDVRFHFCS